MASMISEQESFQGVDGKPIVNGYIYVGVAGQDPKLNPVNIYADRELTTLIANPQRTDAYGRAVNKVWVSDRYSLKVEDRDGSQKYQDLQRGELADSPTINLVNVQGINTVTADAVPAVSSYIDKAVYVLTVVNSNTGAVTLDFGGGAKPVKKDNGDNLVAGDWPAGSIQRVTYNAFSNRFDTLTFSNVEVSNQIADIYNTLETKLKFAQVRQTVMSGPVDANGRANFLDDTGLVVETSANIIVTVGDGVDANGELNQVFTIPAETEWTIPDNSTRYLHLEITAAGVITPFLSAGRPIYSYTRPASAITNQIWYPWDHTGQAQKWNGSAWVSTNFYINVGEATAASGAITSLISYAYNGMHQATPGTTLSNASALSINTNIGAPFVVDSLQIVFNASNTSPLIIGTYLDLVNIASRGTTSSSDGGFTVTSASSDGFRNAYQFRTSGPLYVQGQTVNFNTMDTYRFNARRAF